MARRAGQRITANPETASVNTCSASGEKQCQDALVPGGQVGIVDADFADTMRFADTNNLITLTSGLHPTINSTTGEIVDNAIVVPEPANVVLLLIGALALVIAHRSMRGVRSLR